MGKTTLLEHFLEEVDDAVVVRANGVASEADVDLGLVDQFLRRAGVEVPDPLSSDHVTAGTALLAALSDLESRSPVIIAIDDTHWSDAASLKALLFASRRLVLERVLTILTVREDELARLPPGIASLASGSSGVTLRAAPLSAVNLRTVARTRGIDMSVRSAERLRDHTDGSPLYVTALLNEFPAERWASADAAWPAPRSYSALVRARAINAPRDARRLIEATAVLGVSCLLDTAMAVAECEYPLEAIEGATGTGLVFFERSDGDVLRFDHPLTRAAIYQSIGASARAQLHTRAASLLGSGAAALEHRVAATPGADDKLADELERVSASARARGSWASVATSLMSASRLSSDQSQRERRLLEAAEAAMYGSNVERAEGLVPELERLDAGPMRDGVLAFVAIGLGRQREAEALLDAAWERCDKVRDPVLAAKIAERRAFLGVLQLRPDDVVEWGRRAIAHSPDNDVTVPLSTWTLVVGLDNLGHADEAFSVLEASTERLGAQLRAGGYPLADVRGALLLARDRAHEARGHLEAAARVQLKHAPIAVASFTHSALTRAEYATGAWDAAVGHADLAMALADEASDPGAQAHSRRAAILVSAARGELTDAQMYADQLAELQLVFANHLAAARIGSAHSAAAHGNAAEVLSQLEPLAAIEQDSSVHDPGHWAWQHVYLDALVQRRQFDVAGAFLDLHEPRLADRDRPSAKAHFARTRGWLAWFCGSRADALGAFREAIDIIAPLDLPYEHARIAVDFGQCLRRDGQRRAAAVQLLEARTRLEALRAAPLLELCDRELEACGRTSTKRKDGRRDQLTPRELAVAKLAAGGMTNREIAAELLLSVKTVENHLSHVFAKRGVRSRGELVLDDD
jgi:DNA-binding CsgD family transcriptional regulator